MRKLYRFANEAQRRFFLVTRVIVAVNLSILMVAIYVILKVIL
ncbi:MAG: hypothetical protein AMDU3_IPLC00001G0198 [Thermoplasmatales archaeon I-plasma]|nr:MAG: hypothetical protein AMDU3_IPLC00001G0198 [Thermoplasmatales archaeon I-plasma]